MSNFTKYSSNDLSIIIDKHSNNRTFTFIIYITIKIKFNIIESTYFK